MSDAPELTALIGAFRRLDAAPAQARILAAQLLKRAQQIAEERGVTRESALAELLAKVVAGRRGDYTGT